MSSPPLRPASMPLPSMAVEAQSVAPAPHSTPVRKPTSKTVVSDPQPKASSSRPQRVHYHTEYILLQLILLLLLKELKLTMRSEIGSQAWQFPDATRISQMLSPKKPKPNGNLNLLSSYQCDVDTPWFDRAVKAATTRLESSPSSFGWPSDPGERAHYGPLARFLNDCVKYGGDALAASRHRGTWYADLHFLGYDKEMGDGVGGAHALKPDVSGVIDASRPKKKIILYWSPPDSSKTLDQMHIPGEVKDDWLDMVSQAATYGRCLFSADPSRTFALVLAYNHITHEFRFLIFHRGGLTSHESLRLDTPAGRALALRLIMTILLWSEPHHAGFLSTSNNFEFMIPQDSQNGEAHIWATVTQVLHDSVYVRGRGTRVSRLKCGVLKAESPVALVPTAQTGVLRRQSPRLQTKPPTQSTSFNPAKTAGSRKALPISPRFKSNYALKWTRPKEFTAGQGTLDTGNEVILKSSWQVDSRKNIERDVYRTANGSFGTPGVLCSYEGVHPTGEPISNHLLLPVQDEVANVHWDIFANPRIGESAEARTLCFTVSNTIGLSLVHAPSSYDLCIALVNAMLGWLSMYESGFMHRDIGIGNVLLAERKWFPPPFALESSSKILGATLPPTESSVHGSLSRLSIQTADTLAEEIRQLVEMLQVGKECTAFVTDGDMAAKWETYFDSSHNIETRSGTPEFMSIGLHRAMVKSTEYLQSPVDDIESFFWLACWAVLFNNHKHNEKRSPMEIQWQEYLRSAEYESARLLSKSMLVTELAQPWATTKRRERSSILTEFHPLLSAWWAACLDLQQKWQSLVMDELEKISSDHRKQFLLYHSHSFALEGVKCLLSVAGQHHTRLQNCKKFDSESV
ncbi:hypothetical protein B0H14DRAFT_2491657 [Mycena olivaceomarginata]|nr:hypothetical protein B0H14DRAFT_2491657 [Mycena olivaceomarginata]